MALIDCPECGREISDAATACPHCGLPTPSASALHRAAPTSVLPSPRRQAKIFAAICIGALILVVIGRAGQQDAAPAVPAVTIPDSIAYAHRTDSILSAAEQLLKSTKERITTDPLFDINGPVTIEQHDRIARIRDAIDFRDAPDKRRAYSATLQDKFLDRGLDITVSTTGADGTTLRLDYILAGRVFAHQLEGMADFWSAVWGLGFKRVELVGYDYSNAWQP